MPAYWIGHVTVSDPSKRRVGFHPTNSTRLNTTR